MMRLALAALLLAVTTPAATQTYVMRHLDTLEGQRDPDLLPKGRASAEQLVKWFRGKPLTAIYVSDLKRTRQTAEPLATARKLTPKVYDPAKTPDLIATVRNERGPVLIVGHSNTVPDIVEQLGGTRPPALTHPDFGDIWTIAKGKTSREKLAD